VVGKNCTRLNTYHGELEVRALRAGISRLSLFLFFFSELVLVIRSFRKWNNLLNVNENLICDFVRLEAYAPHV
ncbi:MAG: hypothetical protein WAK20_07950, partial [Candidatus Acidiferrum sp.]